jgi:hypothetical protein
MERRILLGMMKGSIGDQEASEQSGMKIKLF